jgi:hypothetical protein
MLVRMMEDTEVPFGVRAKIAQDLLDRAGLVAAQVHKIVPTTEDPIMRFFEGAFGDPSNWLENPPPGPPQPANDHRYTQWVNDVRDTWLVQSAGEEIPPWGRTFDQPTFGMISKNDRIPLQDALDLRCDAFLTMEQNLPDAAEHVDRKTGFGSCGRRRTGNCSIAGRSSTTDRSRFPSAAPYLHSTRWLPFVHTPSLQARCACLVRSAQQRPVARRWLRQLLTGPY